MKKDLFTLYKQNSKRESTRATEETKREDSSKKAENKS